MSQARSAFSSTIWQKASMAITGLVLFGFVVGHMTGNLKALQGPDKINHYAEFLRTVGAPIFGRGLVLWIVRLVLLGALGVHVAATVSVTRRNRAARPERYVYGGQTETSTVSRTMIVTGPLLLAFVVFHLLHFTTGTVHPSFEEGDVFQNVLTGFRGHWFVLLIYLGAMATLGAHLFHGLWSLFQTLGLNHPKWNKYRGTFAAVASVVLVLGFVAVPLGVVFGVIH